MQTSDALLGEGGRNPVPHTLRGCNRIIAGEIEHVDAHLYDHRPAISRSAESFHVGLVIEQLARQKKLVIGRASLRVLALIGGKRTWLRTLRGRTARAARDRLARSE